MFGLETLGGSAQAAMTVGLVLAEAIALYVGYGAMTRLAGPTARNALRGD
ncbi:DUF7512 family protein [Natrinema salifodinae]|uniref:Uncharacterized protein n=1 Tax=Natrinema salifodinae TaxID=1202768 RepID=A0A1I0QUV0_9EURY|nr:hypothetical protein [Natrinema salifodinae]SEW31423.1 hypothetical protein SAMN05216285_3999 [Natrinema salifodinae]